MLDLTDRQRVLAEEFLGNLGEDGYLQAELAEIVDGANRWAGLIPDEAPADDADDATAGATADAASPATETSPSGVTPGGMLDTPVGVVADIKVRSGPDASDEADAHAAAAAVAETPPVEAPPGEMPFTMAEAEEVLQVLQTLDPAGICARDLRESLLIQLRDLGEQGTFVYQLVHEAFNDLKGHRWTELAKRYGVEPREVQDAADQLARLDPKPGLRFLPADDEYVVPDLVIEKIDGEYRVFLNDQGMPRLRISRTYQSLAGDKKRFTGETRDFITEKLNGATWLIQAIEQRRQTMLKVMRFIVDRQRDFFEKGIEHLHPLTLREVADVVSMHESTISRVTNQKYVQTPRGVFPLKFFFSSSLETTSGEDASARAVRAQIEKLVGDEASDSPLTDAQIVTALRERGIRIARRTVAKYRDQLGILPARMRKRL
jgi:RNA polymerase sigma-54 factor